ncbi:DUF6191 domain-containing protein [Nocardia sp. NPDC051750]|uniref:DUF6191 domain-containing protein n=1 Tax=Nocardia sp. NPDC051750 TaxID=3364325 RepID=UPI0037A7869E
MELLFLGAPAFMLLLGAAAATRWVYSRFPKTGQAPAAHTSTRLAAAGVEEITAFWYGTKRRELDDRAEQSMLRDDHSDGAPPRDRVDLDRGHAVLIARPPERATGTPPPGPADHRQASGQADTTVNGCVQTSDRTTADPGSGVVPRFRSASRPGGAPCSKPRWT